MTEYKNNKRATILSSINHSDYDFTHKQLSKLSTAFSSQRSRAKMRRIEFNLTFKQWLDWWVKSGKLEQRGRGAGHFVMGRVNDEGPYALSNIECITARQNNEDGYRRAAMAAEEASKAVGNIYVDKLNSMDAYDPYARSCLNTVQHFGKTHLNFEGTESALRWLNGALSMAEKRNDGK